MTENQKVTNKTLISLQREHAWEEFRSNNQLIPESEAKVLYHKALQEEKASLKKGEDHLIGLVHLSLADKVISAASGVAKLIAVIELPRWLESAENSEEKVIMIFRMISE